MRKLLSLSLITTFLMTLVVSPAFAVDKPFVDRMTKTGSKAAEKKQEKNDASIERLKERADKEITRRIESLTKLLTRIAEFKKLSSSQKSSLTAQVQTEIDKLTALQAKIEADTDLATLKTDVQSIVDAYRIYALFMPKIQILGAADRVLTVTDEMTTQADRLEEKIAEQEAAGQDVTEAEALLADMEAKIAEAKTQAQSAIDTVTPLTPEGYPDNKTELQSAFSIIRSAHQSLKTAHQDARKIIAWLVQLRGTDSPTVTTTP